MYLVSSTRLRLSPFLSLSPSVLLLPRLLLAVMHAISVKVRARERVSRYTRGNPSFYKLRVHQPAYSVARRLLDQLASPRRVSAPASQSADRWSVVRSHGRWNGRSVGRSLARRLVRSSARLPCRDSV